MRDFFLRLRNILRRTGIDIRRYRAEPHPLAVFKGLGIRTVLDIGANTGQFSRGIRAVLPEARIIAFEPLRDCYQELRENMQGDARFEAHNVALGEREEEKNIHRSSYSLSSSLLPMAELHKELFPHTKGETSERVRVARLDDGLKGEQLEPPLLLKIDVQGYEEKVLAGSPHTLQAVDTVLAEVSFVELYERQPLFPVIYRLMEQAGFSYRGALHQKRDKETGAVLFEDALFLR